MNYKIEKPSERVLDEVLVNVTNSDFAISLQRDQNVPKLTVKVSIGWLVG